MATSQRRRRCGFTLIELLVAITILAIVAVLSWRGLDSIVRARLALNAELANTRGMQISFAQLQSDCLQLAAPAMTGNHVPVDIAANRLLLIRTVYGEQQPGMLHVISYRLAGGVLTRQESAGTRDLDTLNALWQSALDDALDAPAVPLQTQLGAMQLRLWDARAGWRNPEAVTAAGPSTYTGLEVNLYPDRRRQPIVKVLLLGVAG